MRFLAEYVREHRFLRERFEEYVRLIARRSRQRHVRGLRRRDRRCLEDNRRFKRIRSRGFVGHSVRDVVELREKLFAMIPPNGMSQPHARLVKNSATSTVWEQTLDLAGLRRTIFVKRYNLKKLRSPVLDVVRGSRALRGWRLANALLNRGIAVARPLAAVERRVLGFPVTSWLVTEGVAGGVTLREWMAGEPAGGRRRELACALGRWVGRLHEAGFSARDLKPNNLLVGEDDGRPTCVLVDFDGVVRARAVSVRRRVRDIARLAMGFEGESGVRDVDRMRFLTGYLGRAGRAKRVRRRWWDLIRRKVEAKQAR